MCFDLIKIVQKSATMQDKNGKGDCENKLIVHYMLSFKQMCLVTVSCPLVALIICFVTAYIFQADEIHEDHCKVYKITVLLLLLSYLVQNFCNVLQYNFWFL